MTKIRLTLYLGLSIFVGIFIGFFIVFASISMVGEGLDGEYFRALKTIGGSEVNWIDAIFRYCVLLLVNIAKVLGISYEALNIWVFIRIQPLIILGLFLWILRLRKKIKDLQTY